MVNGLHYDASADEWVDGTIYDATTGKSWDSVVWLTKDSVLKVKGYWLFKFLSETRTFKRVSDTSQSHMQGSLPNKPADFTNDND